MEIDIRTLFKIIILQYQHVGKGEKGWKESHKGKFFGETYDEASPRIRRKNYLAHRTNDILGRHLLPETQVVDRIQCDISTTVYDEYTCRVLYQITGRCKVLLLLTVLSLRGRSFVQWWVGLIRGSWRVRVNFDNLALTHLGTLLLLYLVPGART